MKLGLTDSPMTMRAHTKKIRIIQTFNVHLGHLEE